MSDFILVLLVIILLFSFFRRFIFFFILKAVSERLFNQVKKQHSAYSEPEKPEGTVTIDTTNSKSKKKLNDDDGEFVPYEEVK